MKKRKLIAVIFSIVIAVGLLYPPEAGKVLAEQVTGVVQETVTEQAAGTVQETGAGQTVETEQAADAGQLTSTGDSTGVETALFTVEKADACTITVSSDTLDRIYTDVTIGSKKPVTEMYKLKAKDGKKSVNIDISYLKGKDSEVKIYSRKEKTKAVTVKVSAQPKKLKGKFNAKEGTFTVTVAGSAVKNEEVMCRIGRNYKLLSEYNFENYYVKGATAYIYTVEKSSQTAEGNIGIGESVTITPASKEAKIKIPARAKGPSVSVAWGTIAMYVSKGWVYQTTGKDGKVVSEAATAAKWIDIREFVSRAGIDIATTDENERKTASDAAVIEVYKAATDTKLASKTTEIAIPWQPIFDNTLISSTSGISYEPLYNSGRTKQTGIKLTNKSAQSIQAAVLAKGMELSDINLLETDASKKLAWVEVKPNRTASITGDKVVSGAQVVYRLKGAAATSTTKLIFASTISADPERITVAEAAASDDKMVEISSTPPEGTNQSSASCTALTIKEHTGAVKYAYTIKDRGISGVKLGSTFEDIKNEYGSTDVKELDISKLGSPIQIEIKENQYIIAFAMDAKGQVIAYRNMQVTKNYMY